MFKKCILAAMLVSFVLGGCAEAGVVLVLSGGGTRGLAHIGVIEVLEENGIPVIGVVGTSMGSLIGALKASGYSAAEMRKIIEELDLPSLMAEHAGPMFVFTGDDRRAKTSTISALTYRKRGDQDGMLGLLAGDKLYQYFSKITRHINNNDFFQLPVPYAAVAADIYTGEKVVLDSGDIASAMRASMSIPGFFEPWTINGRMLVDGGIVSNLPVYTAQDIFPGMPILAVDVSAYPVADRPLNSFVDVLDQSFTILMRRTTNEESSAADVVVSPLVKNFGSLDTSETAAVIEAGRTAALEKIEEIKAISERGPGLIEVEKVQLGSGIVGDIRITGLPEKMAAQMMKNYNSWIGKAFNADAVEDALEKFERSPGIAMANYQLDKTDSGDVRINIDVKESPEIEVGFSGYTTNLNPNRWLYLKGTAHGLLSDYDSLSGVLRIGEQWGVDLAYQTEPETMNAWKFTLAAHNWNIDSFSGHRDWNRYAFGVSKLFQVGDVSMGLGVAYEHVAGDSISDESDRNAVGPTFYATYDTLDIPGDPTSGHAWRLSAWWPDLDEINYRLTYFKPLQVSDSWRTYFRFGFAEGDLDRPGHAAYLGGAEELYSISSHPIEAERMAWANLSFRRILMKNVLGTVAGEIFASYGYAMDKHYHKLSAPWEVGVAVNVPNNLFDIKLAAMYGSEEFSVGFFLGVPIWDHFPLP